MRWRPLRARLCAARLLLSRRATARPWMTCEDKRGGGCGVAGYSRRAIAAAPRLGAGTMPMSVRGHNVVAARGDGGGRGKLQRRSVNEKIRVLWV